MTATEEVQLTEAFVPEVSNGNAPPVCLPPWRENPYRLVSLLDMMRFYAENFCRCSTLLGQMCSKIQEGVTPSNASWGIIGGELGLLEKYCTEMDLAVTGSQIKRLKHLLGDSGGTLALGYIGQQLTEVQTRLIDELASRTFLSISPSRASYYEPKEPLFGKQVADSFPSTVYDVAEAGKCYALYRSTACVFHLMRALEIGLRVFAVRFNIPSDRQNWHNIIEGIEKAVRGMDKDPARPADWKDQQEFFSGAATHFMFVKDAWRNFVAHGRDKSTEEEAEVVFNSVRGFMQKLAPRLHE
jgi:hypothetical protein